MSLWRAALSTVVLVASLGLAACKTDASDDPLAIIGTATEWTVTDIAGTAVPDGVDVTVAQPDPGHIAGRSGCNRYTGGVSSADGALTLGPIAGTRMMCPEPQMQVETAFLAALPHVKGAKLENGILVLTDSAGKPVLKAHK